MEAARAIIETDQRHPDPSAATTRRTTSSRSCLVEGRNEMLIDAGRQAEYIDGLSGLWNVNAGHGRKELADAAAAADGEAGLHLGLRAAPQTSRVDDGWPRRSPKRRLFQQPAICFTTAGAESNESAFKIVAAYAWKLKRPSRAR